MDSPLAINGTIVKRLRIRDGLTQGQLAYQTKVDQSLISRIESGETKDIKNSTAGRLAAALDVTVNDITIGGAWDQTSPKDLPDFHTYIHRKFEGNKVLQDSLIKAYEAIRSVQEKYEERARKAEERAAETERWRKAVEDRQK